MEDPFNEDFPDDSPTDSMDMGDYDASTEDIKLFGVDLANNGEPDRTENTCKGAGCMNVNEQETPEKLEVETELEEQNHQESCEKQKESEKGRILKRKLVKKKFPLSRPQRCLGDAIF